MSLSSSFNGFFILGAGGHAQDILDIYMSYPYSSDTAFFGYLDDREKGPNIHGKIDDWPEVKKEYQEKYPGWSVGYVIGVNSSEIRERIYDRMIDLDNRAVAVSLIHSTAYVGTNCTYGPGLIMGPHSALTSNVILGSHVHINTGASVNQASTLGDCCTLSPGARICGDVIVGDSVSFGANSTVINLKAIGHYSTIGAGAVVVSDIPPNSVAVGVPAKVIKSKV